MDLQDRARAYSSQRRSKSCSATTSDQLSRPAAAGGDDFLDLHAAGAGKRLHSAAKKEERCLNGFVRRLIPLSKTPPRGLKTARVLCTEYSVRRPFAQNVCHVPFSIIHPACSGLCPASSRRPGSAPLRRRARLPVPR